MWCASPPETRACGRAVILIVDDEPSALVLLEMVLRQDKQVVLKARSGKEALGLLERESSPCRLAIVDIHMPGIDGRELIFQMRANPRLASIPVIMCTGQADRSTVTEMIGQGVRDYIVKPIVPSVVLNKVRAVLADRGPLIEPRDQTIRRLAIDPLEYVPLAHTTIKVLDGLAEELSVALRVGNARAARLAALKSMKPAGLFGARIAIDAAEKVSRAPNNLDTLHCAGTLMTEIGLLRSALMQTGLVGRSGAGSGPA